MFLDGGSTASTIFFNTTGQDIINSGTNSNFLFIDQVPAAYKPTDSGGDHGIMAQGGSNSTLEVDVQVDDALVSLDSTYILSTDDGSSSSTIERNSSVNHLKIVAPFNGITINANARFLSSTIPLLIQTGSATGDTIHIGGGEDSSVTNVTIQTGAGNDSVQVTQDDDDDGATSALVDFGSSGLGSGNALVVGDTGRGTYGEDTTVSLADAPGTSSHSIDVDTITVYTGGTLTIDSATNAKHISVLDGEIFAADSTMQVNAPLTVSNTSPLIGLVENSGEIFFSGTSGTSTIGAFTRYNSPINGLQDDAVEVDGGAAVIAQNNSWINSLSVNGSSTFTLASRPSGSGARFLRVNNLAVDTAGSASAMLDLKDNDLIVEDFTNTPLSDIKALLTSGFNSHT